MHRHHQPAGAAAGGHARRPRAGGAAGGRLPGGVCAHRGARRGSHGRHSAGDPEDRRAGAHLGGDVRPAEGTARAAATQDGDVRARGGRQLEDDERHGRAAERRQVHGHRQGGVPARDAPDPDDVDRRGELYRRPRLLAARPDADVERAEGRADGQVRPAQPDADDHAVPARHGPRLLVRRPRIAAGARRAAPVVADGDAARAFPARLADGESPPRREP